MTRIAIIEDSIIYAKILVFQLSSRHMDARTYESYESFESKTRNDEWIPDIFIIDYDLGPGQRNGIEVCKATRATFKKPVILLTGMEPSSSKENRVRSYYAGALHFLSKPHDIDELCAIIWSIDANSASEPSRVEALEKYSTTTHIDKYCRYNSFTRSIQSNINNVDIKLTEKECALIEILLKNKNKPVERELAYQQIYGRSMHPLNRSIDNLACRLRSKLSEAGCSILIENHRSLGYRLWHP